MTKEQAEDILVLAGQDLVSDLRERVKMLEDKARRLQSDHDKTRGERTLETSAIGQMMRIYLDRITIIEQAVAVIEGE